MVAQQTGGFVAVVDAKFATGAVAVGVDRRLGHAELAGDFLRAEMLVDEAQAFAFALGQQLDRITRKVRTRRHAAQLSLTWRFRLLRRTTLARD
jgi:hypothetical protein